MNKSIVIKLGDYYYRIHFVYNQTRHYFKSFRSDQNEELPAVIYDIPSVDQNHLIEETERLKDPCFAEYSLLIESIVNVVLQLNQFFFHGAAFIWKGSAFIFTGLSGVGKSTQLMNWMKLFPEEIEIINGDKPLIEIRDDRFMVFPSPWSGKENMNGTKSAKLKGIILLEQGDSDHIDKLDIKDAVFPLFLQFLYKPEDLQSVNIVCEYEEKLLSAVPVWKLVNRGTPESALLTHSLLSQEAFQ